MKTISKLLSVFLVISMLFSLCACGNSGDSGNNANGEAVFMKYGDITLTESEYKYIASYIKDAVVYNQQNYLYQYTGTVYEEADILAMSVDEDTTVADYIKDYSAEFAQQMLIIEKICADSGIQITEQTDIDEISGYVGDIEYAYGGEDLFEVALARLGFSRSGIERFQEFYVLYDLLYEARYGENGSARVSEESVNTYFVENYLRYDGAMYSYVNSEDGSDINFEYSDAEVREYFNDNYVKVRHILYKTVDSSYNPLSEDEIASKKSTAESALAAIQSGKKSFDDYLSDNEDGGSEYLFTYGEMVEAFETASFEMAVGDIRLVETEYGYHLIEKLAKTDADFVGTENEEGEIEGGVKDEVISAMSVEKIRNEALATLDKLNNGELTEYPKESEDVSYYVQMGSSFIDKTDSNYQTLIDILSELETGVYVEKEFPSDATYILRSIAFTAEDITTDIYSTIEESLAVESFAEYVQSFYDSVEINNEVLDRLDINTLPLLEEEFYVE